MTGPWPWFVALVVALWGTLTLGERHATGGETSWRDSALHAAAFVSVVLVIVGLAIGLAMSIKP